MAPDAQNLPPPQFIVPKTGHRLAADATDHWALSVDVFDPDKNEQQFHILPDGRIGLPNGKFTAPGFYESQVQVVDEKSAYKWIIMETSDGCTINHINGNVWTFGDPFKPIEIKPKNMEQELQEFHMLDATPGLATNTTTSVEEAITAVPTDKLIITGAQRGPGPLPARLDVDTFATNERFLALYIQALMRIHKDPEDQLLSFYQVAGLHGVPLVPWNQALGGSGSYCRHASPLFPTWHRPYVALFEQILQKHALQIADEYKTEKEEWKKAALELRQPYWDWAKPGGATPPALILSRTTIRINTPKGFKDVENPLLFYQFKSDRSTVAFPPEFVPFKRTIRHPYSDTPTNDIRSQTRNAQQKLTMNTHDLFSLTTWDAFSNKAQTKDGASNSLEAVHDTLHVLVGRNGHFASACGSFDPLFFFHHAQVDRLIALWDVLHNQWVPGADAKEQLAPFWNTERTYWTSEQIRNHEIFNHTYPELQNVRGNLRDHVRQAVDTLYGGPTREIFKDIYVGNKLSMTSWSVHISIKPFTIDRSYSIVVFLDSVPKDPLTWLTSPELVGSYDVFIAYQPDECENCRSHQDVPIEGFVHITSTLQDRLSHLQSDRDVTNYLEENLYLGLVKVDGTIVNLHTIEFKAEVVSRSISKGSARGADVSVGQPKYYPFDIKPYDTFQN